MAEGQTMRNLPEPARDLVLIRTEEETQAVLDALPEIPSPFDALPGENHCPFCPQAFGTLQELGTHIRADHSVASGQADMRPVELPDGTVVPAEALADELVESRKRMEELETDLLRAQKKQGKK